MYENYGKCVDSIEKGVPMEDEAGFEPNYPKGYRYEPWSIEQIIKDKKAGREIDLGAGDWN